MSNEKSTRLSYSSASLLLNCEERYYQYKVLETTPDADIEQDDAALIYGSAFHEALENTLHTAKGIKESYNQVVNKYLLADQPAQVLMMSLASYLRKHKENPFKVIACELKIETPTYVGYVDAIAKNDKDEWIIIDLKTAARLFGAVEKKLPDDFQLNIYTYYKKHLAEQLDLDESKFVGCSYRVTLKSKLKHNKRETLEEYQARLLKACISHDFFIPKDMMDPERFGILHDRLYDKSMMLRNKTVKPIRNYNYCEAFFRPCVYWSKCHKHRFSSEPDLEI